MRTVTSAPLIVNLIRTMRPYDDGKIQLDLIGRIEQYHVSDSAVCRNRLTDYRERLRRRVLTTAPQIRRPWILNAGRQHRHPTYQPVSHWAMHSILNVAAHRILSRRQPKVDHRCQPLDALLVHRIETGRTRAAG